MNQQEILAAARSGDVRAIAFIINHTFRQQGVRSRLKLDDGCLHVLLEAESVPDRDIYSRALINGMLRLNSSTIASLRLYGRQIGQPRPAWTCKLALRVPPPPPNPPASPRLGESWIRVLKANVGLPLVSFASVSFVLGLGWGFWSYKADSPSIAAPTPAAQRHLGLPSGVGQPLQPGLLTIKAVGDIMPSSDFPRDRAQLSSAPHLPPEPGQALFQAIRPYLQGADLVFGNFESTLTNSPHAAEKVSRSQSLAFRTPPVYAQILKDVGFSVLNVANDHALDFSEVGFADTVRSIQQAGMQAIGQKGQIAYHTVKGKTIAAIGFSYLDSHNSIHDLATATALVQTAKQHAQVVLISVHAGAEGRNAAHVPKAIEQFAGENRGDLAQFAHTVVDAGADLVLGHGPHVLRALELYKGKLIAYSLGSFVGYQASTSGELTTSAILQVQLDSQGDFVRGKLVPVHLDGTGIPFFDSDYRSARLVRWLTRSDFPNTPLTIDNQGNLTARSL